MQSSWSRVVLVTVLLRVLQYRCLHSYSNVLCFLLCTNLSTYKVSVSML